MQTNETEYIINKYGEELFGKQLEIEATYKNIAGMKLLSGIEKQVQNGNAIGAPVAQKLVNSYIVKARDAIKEELEKQIEPKAGVKPDYYFIILQIDELYSTPEKLEEVSTMIAYMCLATLFDCLAGKTVLNNLTKRLGEELEAEMELELFMQQGIKEHHKKVIINSLENGIKKRVQMHYKRYYAKHYRQLYIGTGEWNWAKWDGKTVKNLAAKLLDIVIEETPFFEYFLNTGTKGSEQREVYPTKWLLTTWQQNNQKLAMNAFKFAPTIIPPKPWTTFRDGGYYGELSDHCSLLRLGWKDNTRINKKYMEMLDQLELAEVKQAINLIQATPWQVNKQVLDVLQKIVKLGGDRAGVPRLEPLPNLPELVGEFTEEQLKDHKRKMCDQRRAEKRRETLALRALALLDMAQKFSDYEQIYFPHNMDFRGRVYPLTGAFSPQSDDLGKGLLLFADAPPCTDNKAIEWLMVHGANLAGVDKVTFEERQQWVVDNEQHILKSAADPIGCPWWMEQEEPVQFLGFCFEWQRWKNWEQEHDGDAKGFVSGMPIAFDGSCSGLQHFSAILRDAIGGAAVNLVPAEKPQDIYGKVAEKVNELLKTDLKSGTMDEWKERKSSSSSKEEGGEEQKSYLALGTKTLAQMWFMYGVDRKVCKRSTMTLCYGSKEYGFKMQLLEDIVEPAIREGKGCFSDKTKTQAAAYMAKLIWKSVQKVVVKATEGMDWLQKMAKLVTKGGHVVTWWTPMGLPVQQGYMKTKTVTYRVRLRSARISMYDQQATGDIDKASQASGIAPNFIHSMDASHLQLTVLNAHKKGLEHFAMIHDSYGTTPAKADILASVVRESFIQMYSENSVLEEFKKHMQPFINEKDLKKLPDIPEKGSLNLEEVRQSLYCFA